MAAYPLGVYGLVLRGDDTTMAKKKGTSHTNQISRLNRVEGQIRGIAKMIEDKRYCIDILTQIKAVKSAITTIETSILEEHMRHCVLKALTSKNRKETDEMVDELVQTFQRSRN